MLGARGWMTSWAGCEVEEGGGFLFWCPLPGGRGITAVPGDGYKPWLSASWYSAACLASASFLPTTNLGSGRSLTGQTEISFSVKQELRYTMFDDISLKGSKIYSYQSVMDSRIPASIPVINSPHFQECLEWSHTFVAVS